MTVISRPDLVIFDCDGVLVDSEPLTHQMLAQNLSSYGYDIDAMDVTSRFTGVTMASIYDLVRNEGVPLPEGWIEDFYASLYQALDKSVEAIPGVAGVLDCLDSNAIRYCVASNGRDEKMRITLSRTGLWDRFEGRMFSAYSVGIAKPEPGLFLHAAEVLGVDPDRVLVVEDSLTGIRAANAADMKVAAYTPDGAPQAIAELATLTFQDMGVLPDLLGLT